MQSNIRSKHTTKNIALQIHLGDSLQDLCLLHLKLIKFMPDQGLYTVHLLHANKGR